MPRLTDEEKKAALDWLEMCHHYALSGRHVERAAKHSATIRAMLAEAEGDIDALRKQSRGHFEAMTAVLRDGIKAVTPPEFHDALPEPKLPKAN